MGVIAEGILRGCQGLFTPVSLGYPLSVFNKNSTLTCNDTGICLQYIVAKPSASGLTLSQCGQLSLSEFKQKQNRD